MKKNIFLVALLVFNVFIASTQIFDKYACPENGNAESNNFTNWGTYTGTAVNPQTNNSFVQNFDPLRFGVHQATGINSNFTIPGNDPMLINGQDYYGQFMIPSEGTTCFRVGNNGIIKQADLMRFSFTVNEGNKHFKFRYAVVLQDGGHDPGLQPDVTMYMTRGISITPTSAADYTLYNATVRNVVADLNNPFFIRSNVQDDVIYKDWQCVEYDLSNYVGQVVSFCFRTRDCTQSAHFGYAYLDGLCTNWPAIPEISLNATEFCLQQPVIMDAGLSVGENSYFVEVAEVDATGNWAPDGMVVNQWFVAQEAPDGFNVTDFIEGTGNHFECGKYYHVKLAVVNDCSPWKDKEKIIHIVCPPVYAGRDTLFCCGEGIENDAFQIGSDALHSSSYSWTSIPDGFTSEESNPTINPSQSTAYIVTVTTENGCMASDTIVVRYIPGAFLMDLSLQYKICNQNAHVTAHLDPYGCENSSEFNEAFPYNPENDVSWYFMPFGSMVGSKLGKGQTVIAPNAEGILYAKFTTPCGYVSSQIAIHPVTAGSREMIAPNTFTPDGDEFNNIFQILEFGEFAPYLGDITPAYDAIDFKLRIYNRWGDNFRTVTKADVGRQPDEALQQGDIQWDGKDQYGDLVQTGVYNYTLEMKYCGSEGFVRVRTPNG